MVLSVDPRAAGITQHHNVILALCKPATAVATTRTLHYPSHSSRRRRGNPWSQVSRRPPATTHPLQKTDSIDRLPRLAGLSARGGLALPLAPRCGRARSEPYCACARSGRCTEPLVPGLHMSGLPCERSVGCASGLAMARARGAPVGDGLTLRTRAIAVRVRCARIVASTVARSRTCSRVGPGAVGIRVFRR